MQDASDLDPLELHLAYHASHLPERGPYSTCMHRPDARTFSFSWLRLDGSSVEYRYTPRSPCRGIPREPLVSLPRRSVA